MKSWTQFLAETETKYDYSSTQINLPDNISSKIIQLGKDIDDKDIMIGKDDSLRRETEIHVTLLYGLHSSIPDEVVKILKKQTSFEYTLGTTSLFTTNPDFDVLKLDVSGDGLKKLNSLLKKLPHTNRFPIYKPHVTIAYLKKGKGVLYDKKEKFKGMTLKANKVIFSSHNGKKTEIKLID